MSQEDIIYLESDEEIPTIIEKIKKSADKRIKIVLPRSSVVAQSVINLRMLHRKAIDLDKDISIVTSDPISQNLANQVGLTVFNKVDANEVIHGTKHQPPSSRLVVEADEQDEKSNNTSFPVHHFQELTSDEHELSGDEQMPETTQNKIIDDSEDRPKEISHNHIGKIENIKPRRSKKPLFIGLIIIILTMIGIFLLLPTAVVTLTVFGETFSKSNQIAIIAKDSTDAPSDIARVEGQFITSDKSSSQKFDATGDKNVGQKASGSITLQNGWSQEAQTLPQGSRLSKEGKIFTLNSDTTIPGATLSLKEGKVVTNPGKKTATITAEEPGDGYNLSAGQFSILDIDKDKQSSIYGVSESSLSGGSTKTVKIVTASDIAGAKEKLRQSTLDDAKKDLTDQSAKAKLYLLDSAVDIIANDPGISANEGDEAKQFTVNYKLTAKALVFDETKFRAAFVGTIQKNLPPDKDLVLTAEDQISTIVKEKHFDKGNMIIDASITSTIRPKFSESEIKSKIRNKSLSNSRNILDDDSRFEDVNVTLKPNWIIQRVPILSCNIKIKVEFKNKT